MILFSLLWVTQMLFLITILMLLLHIDLILKARAYMIYFSSRHQPVFHVFIRWIIALQFLRLFTYYFTYIMLIAMIYMLFPLYLLLCRRSALPYYKASIVDACRISSQTYYFLISLQPFRSPSASWILMLISHRLSLLILMLFWSSRYIFPHHINIITSYFWLSLFACHFNVAAVYMAESMAFSLRWYFSSIYIITISRFERLSFSLTRYVFHSLFVFPCCISRRFSLLGYIFRGYLAVAPSSVSSRVYTTWLLLH